MPTINVPPNLAAWAEQLNDDDVIIVVGNERSPHDGIRKLLSTLENVRSIYMHPDEDMSTKWMISDTLPKNDHCRHALGLLEAMRWRPEIIINLDDDNFPASPHWVETVHHMLMNPNRSAMVLHSSDDDKWYNPGRLCDPQVMHRGFPHWKRHDRPLIDVRSPKQERIGVFASLWYGDPDIDATERLVLDPQVETVAPTRVIARDTWSVFNSQSTAIRGELAPLYMMWPGVGRFDDIWASYTTRVFMDRAGWHHAAGSPAVRQDRNPHDLVRDLENELFGYRHNESVIKVLRESDNWSITANTSPFDAVKEIMNRLSVELVDVLPDVTLQSFNRWKFDTAAVRAEISNG